MRLLAYKVPSLQESAYGEMLGDVEGLIVAHFASALTEDEKSHLKLCRQLRNKILHCDFHAERNKLREIGANVQSGNVRSIDISGPSRQEMEEKITAASGASEYVANRRGGPGTVYGWLHEAGEAGDFTKAADSFASGAAIIDRLAGSSP